MEGQWMAGAWKQNAKHPDSNARAKFQWIELQRSSRALRTAVRKKTKAWKGCALKRLELSSLQSCAVQLRGGGVKRLAVTDPVRRSERWRDSRSSGSALETALEVQKFRSGVVRHNQAHFVATSQYQFWFAEMHDLILWYSRRSNWFNMCDGSGICFVMRKVKKPAEHQDWVD
jgi:hypothetical protein